MDLPTQLVQYYRWLRQYGLNDSHSGNASVREGDTVWITPTGACADTLEVADLIPCHLGQTPPPQASLDAPLHLSVYQHNIQARAVLHSHGPYIVALTLNGEDFVPVDFEGQYYFSTIPVLNIAYDQYEHQSPQLVAETLAHHRATIVSGHGLYVQAKTLNLAYKWSCSLELSAKTAFIAQQIHAKRV
ncbi:MAG: class II aldolase/adducin family protein [Pseudomonadota bacterium]|nr:class II aldolase/adducin family protein [Pseudomonadota bacterium]